MFNIGKINMKKFFIFLLTKYKKHISPILGKLGVHCKYYPSCSTYMIQAIEKYGCFIGIFKGIVRILKCNPFSKGGYDPLI